MKYRNTPTTRTGEKYRSKREANRHAELLLMQKAGHIYDLQREVAYVLAPSVRIEGEKRARPAIRYVADFVYRLPDGTKKVVDAKGVSTPVWRLKKHLMAVVHGISVVEV